MVEFIMRSLINVNIFHSAGKKKTGDHDEIVLRFETTLNGDERRLCGCHSIQLKKISDLEHTDGTPLSERHNNSYKALLQIQHWVEPKWTVSLARKKRPFTPLTWAMIPPVA